MKVEVIRAGALEMYEAAERDISALSHCRLQTAAQQGITPLKPLIAGLFGMEEVGVGSTCLFGSR
jgi:hypothetical protein